MKEIKGFESYGITEDGNVINLKTGKRLRPFVNSNGYVSAQFTIKGKHFVRLIHRMIAEAFIPNPEAKPYVNHIDGNKLNNSIDNLEWCTAQENTEHAAKVLKVIPQYEENNRKRQRPVQGTHPDGTKTEVFPSIRSACNATGANKATLIGVLHGRKKTCRGMTWDYA